MSPVSQNLIRAFLAVVLLSVLWLWVSVIEETTRKPVLMALVGVIIIMPIAAANALFWTYRMRW